MSDLKRIVKLAELLKEQKAAVDQLKQKLKEAEADYRRIEREDLPQLMAEIGVNEITLDSGARVTIAEDVDTRISDANRAAAHRWLIDNGFGGLIKTAVAVTFGRGEHDAAVAVRDSLAREYPDVSLEERVHHSTLKAFVREQLAEGRGVPMDLFGVYPYSKAIIKEK